MFVYYIMTTLIETIGYICFILSEIVAVLPIPANGFLHSLFIGLNNSIRNSNTDIEMAQQLITTKPNTASLLNKIAINSELSNTVKKITDNPDILPFINLLSAQPQLQYILSLLQNNPDIINDVKQLIETNITQHQIQRQIVQQQIIQQRQLAQTLFTSSSSIEDQLKIQLQQLSQNNQDNHNVPQNNENHHNVPQNSETHSIEEIILQ